MSDEKWTGPCSEHMPNCSIRRTCRLSKSTSISKFHDAHENDEIHVPLPRYMHDPNHIRSSLCHIHVPIGGRVDDDADGSETGDCVSGSDTIKSARLQIVLHDGRPWLATRRARYCWARTAPPPTATQMQRSMPPRKLDRRAGGVGLTFWTRAGGPSHLVAKWPER